MSRYDILLGKDNEGDDLEDVVDDFFAEVGKELDKTAEEAEEIAERDRPEMEDDVTQEGELIDRDRPVEDDGPQRHIPEENCRLEVENDIIGGTFISYNENSTGDNTQFSLQMLITTNLFLTSIVGKQGIFKFGPVNLHSGSTLYPTTEITYMHTYNLLIQEGSLERTEPYTQRMNLTGVVL